MIELFHASPEKISEITDEGLFGGVFASASDEVALSHADNLHKIVLDESDICTQSFLNYDVDYQTVKSIILEECSEMSDDELDEIYNIIVEDKSVHDVELDEARILSILKAEDLAHASWKGQKIRGVIAKKLGFKAIEMDDEHGLTYLVLDGVAITQI